MGGSGPPGSPHPGAVRGSRRWWPGGSRASPARAGRACGALTARPRPGAWLHLTGGDCTPGAACALGGWRRRWRDAVLLLAGPAPAGPVVRTRVRGGRGPRVRKGACVPALQRPAVRGPGDAGGGCARAHACSSRAASRAVSPARLPRGAGGGGLAVRRVPGDVSVSPCRRLSAAPCVLRACMRRAPPAGGARGCVCLAHSGGVRGGKEGRVGDKGGARRRGCRGEGFIPRACLGLGRGGEGGDSLSLPLSLFCRGRGRVGGRARRTHLHQPPG